MNTTNMLTNFDITLILAMPIEQATYTPRNIPQPEDASEVAALTENERKLYHFMVACRVSEEYFLSEAQSRYAEHMGLLYTSKNLEELRLLEKQIKEDDISCVLFREKSKAAQDIFWGAVRSRINSVLHRQDGEYIISVYGDNKIGLAHRSTQE